MWVVLSDPSKDSRVVIANVSTLRSTNCHLGCTVASHEHGSLSRPSVLRCDQARLTKKADLERLIQNRTVQDTKQASDALVTKLQASLCESPHTANEVKELLKSQGLCAAEAKVGGARASSAV